MLFADDAAVCAHSEEELQEIMQIFYQTFQEFGLQLALKKTEVMMQKSYPDETRAQNNPRWNSTKTCQIV